MVLLGPTASGKSQLAMAIALARPGTEIVVADSMQVYRGMDIGTAKPTVADQSAVRHHLIDLVEPGHDYTVSEFQNAYGPVIADIEARGARALIVAGTGLYLRAITDGLIMAGQYPDVRGELDQEPDAGVLHARLAALDPVAASRMEPSNRRRIERALEVTLGAGRPFSSFGDGLTNYAPTRVPQFGIRFERERQADSVRDRVHLMIANGWLSEAQSLANKPVGRTAAQALGYRELFAHLRGETSLSNAIETTVIRTRQFAARQVRWFRRDPRISWLEIGPEKNSLDLLDVALRQYDSIEQSTDRNVMGSANARN